MFTYSLRGVGLDKGDIFFRLMMSNTILDRSSELGGLEYRLWAAHLLNETGVPPSVCRWPPSPGSNLAEWEQASPLYFQTWGRPGATPKVPAPSSPPPGLATSRWEQHMEGWVAGGHRGQHRAKLPSTPSPLRAVGFQIRFILLTRNLSTLFFYSLHFAMYVGGICS